MNRIKRILAFVLIVALIPALLTSCKKTPSDTEAFKKLSNAKGYVIYDVTEQYINAPQIKEATIAAPSDKSFQIEFYIITDLDSAKELFKAQSEVMESTKGDSWSGNVSNGKNYAKRTLTTGGKYMVLSYIENTMLYVPPTPTDNEDNLKAIDAFIDEFHY